MAMSAASSGSGRRRRGGSRRAPMGEINVTPLVDVMLVLLIIFMVTAPLMTAGVPVDLPDSRANPLQQEQDQVTVAVDSNGYIYLNDTLIEAGGFGDALASLDCDSASAPLVTVRADKTLQYGRVMAVMGELNRAGCNKVSLVTNSSVEAP